MWLNLMKTVFFRLKGQILPNSLLAAFGNCGQTWKQCDFGNIDNVASVDEDSLFFALHVQSWQICCKKVTFACF